MPSDSGALSQFPANPETAAGLQNLLTNGFNALSVTDDYIFPPEQRPELSTVSSCEKIPVIDLKGAILHGPERTEIVQQISKACEKFGFFQIINHGVPEELIGNMLRIAKEFFEMPVEDRADLYSEDSSSVVRVGTSFSAPKKNSRLWRDYVRHPCHPLEDYIDLWPKKPEDYREIAGKYAVEIRSLVLKLLGLLSEGLGLETGYLNEKFGKHNQILLINYYPACPDPSLTMGLPGHSDPDGITVLLQGDVAGLQVLKDGKWIEVEPNPTALVVNLADQLQVISNGRFKSVEHRAVTNSKEARVSIPTFYGPSMDAYITPAQSLVDEHNPAKYQGHTFQEFMDVFWSKDLKRKSVLDHFTVRHPLH